MSALKRNRLGVVGDIGGTNARFALAELAEGGAKILRPASLPAKDHASVYDAALTYLGAEAPPGDLDFAVFACAGPVRNDTVALTNLAWTVGREELEKRLNVVQAHVINDLEAVAFAAPRLCAGDTEPVGVPGLGLAGGAIAVVGAGTGFNAAAFIPHKGRGRTVMVGEAGHASFSAVSDLEIEILRHLTLRFGHVSVERVLSGPGVLNIYQALAAINGEPAAATTPAEVSALAKSGDALAVQTLERFCEALGSECGDIALNFGARGGVFIAGGIAPGLLPMLQRGAFRRRFEAKAPMDAYLARIPTAVIIQPYAALLGAAEAALAVITDLG